MTRLFYLHGWSICRERTRLHGYVEARVTYGTVTEESEATRLKGCTVFRGRMDAQCDISIYHIYFFEHGSRHLFWKRHINQIQNILLKFQL